MAAKRPTISVSLICALLKVEIYLLTTPSGPLALTLVMQPAHTSKVLLSVIQCQTQHQKWVDQNHPCSNSCKLNCVITVIGKNAAMNCPVVTLLLGVFG